MVDCNNKKGRLLDLCLCKGHEDRPDPTPAECEKYRKLFSSLENESIGIPLAHLETIEAREAWTPRSKSRGLGDIVAKITSALGVTPCGGCKKRQTALNKLWPFKYTPTVEPPVFVSCSQLMVDTKELASRLPPDTSRIIGIARSGLCVATMLSMLIHRPMSVLRQSTSDLVVGGNGWRLTGNTQSEGPVVVIDDTVMSGNSLKHVMPLARKQFTNVISAAVYVNPAATVKPDIWVRDLPWPHILEWNMFNSILSPHMALDFDGILCKDCTTAEDDDGEKYLQFIQNVQPLYYSRKTQVPLIVTARLEKYRPQTEAWLNKHGISVSRLVMGPWANLKERRKHSMAEYKAEHFKQFIKQKHAIKPPLFVESDPRQAETIAKLSGGVVVCPSAGRCYT